jgi:chemotaxis protein methyltransferase CheR
LQLNLAPLIDRVAAVTARASGLLVAGERLSHLERRLQGFIGTHGINMLESLVRKSEQGDSVAIQALRNALSVNYTYFWREPEHFQFLLEHLIVRLRLLMRNKKSPEPPVLRVLSAGCSSGEEAWSMAMMAAEAMRQTGIEAHVFILGVDIDTGIIADAQRCIYNQEVIKDLPIDLRERYLQPITYRHRVHWRPVDRLQKMLQFKTLDLMQENESIVEEDVLFDAIFCRNVIIYLSDSARLHIFKKFSALLQPDGLMILSRVEGGTHHAEPFFKSCGDSVYMLSSAARRSVS